MQAGRFNAASGINDAGAIAGTMASGNIYPNAARWDGDVVTNLATTPTQYSTAVAINASGQIVGEQADPDPFAYLWNGTVPTALPSISNGGMSDGMAINASGQIAGFARPLDGSPGSHAMRWSGNGAPRVATDLGTLGGQNSGAWGINAAAQMVGYAETAGRVRHAALWTNGVVVDLNTALSPAEAAYVTLTMAYAINDHGWIVADGDDTRNPLTPVAYLLTPAMPPCRWDRGSRDAEHGKREHTRPSRERTDRHQMAPDAELGMTPHEVRQSAWGAPVSVNVATHHNQTSELWWYRDNRHLQFANGCLRAIHTERGR
jgi:probable HAF family extracellular repeat protein